MAPDTLPPSPTPRPQVANGAADVSSLKEAGSRAFAMKEYGRAMAAWDEALAAEGLARADAALLHNNKAACHMVGKKFKEALAECSAALEAQPEYFKALTRRAKAHEALGQFRQAAADLGRANKLPAATDDSRAAERRARELAAGRRPAGMGAGLARRAPAGRAAATQAAAAAPAPPQRPSAFPVKLSCGDDVRAFQLVPGITYSELMEHARGLFPTAGHFALKFTDREGDAVTIASRHDVARALQEAAEAAGRGFQAKLAAGTFPAVRLQAVPVASADEVPKVPDDEAAYMAQMLEQLARMQAAQAAARAAAGGPAATAAAQPAEAPAVQVDEWILSFVDLLKEHCGIDPDRPLEAQEVGTEKLNAAFTAMVQEDGDGRAAALLDAAEAKFAETAALGMVAEAQVHEARASLAMGRAAAKGEPAASVAAEAEAHLAAADGRAVAALAYRAATLDAYVMRSNVEQARAKLAAGYLVRAIKPREDVADAAERAAAEEAAGREAVAEASARVTAASAAAADARMDAAAAFLAAALAAMPAEEAVRELRQLKPMAEQGGDPAGEGEAPVKANLLINLGNAHYEHSVLRAAGGLEWRPLVEKAAALFREAKAAEADIRNALKGHPKAEEMADMIGSEPEAEAAPAEAEAAAADAGAPKGGLSALPKKKDAAAA